MPGVDFSAELILVCNSLDAGGIERVVSTLANEWNRRGRRISVITLHDRERFYKLDPTIHHIVVEQQGTTWLSSFLRNGRDRLVKLRRLKPYMIKLLGSSIYYFFSEIIHRTHFILYLTFETLALRQALKRVESPVVVSFGTSVNVVTLKACKRLKKRVIISERNDPARLIQLWERLWRKHYRRAHLVTANTRTALRDISAFVEPNKLAFVPNPIVVGNSSGHRQRNGNGKAPAHARAPFILNVGRLVWDKAHEVLLEAFALLGDDLPDWRLAVLGNGKLQRDLYLQAADLGINERVDWHGLVADPFVFYRSAMIFALPSRVEGTPNALLEAMSCGLPVVISDGAPGPLELIEDGHNGLIVPVNDPAALATALRKLANDEGLRRRLGSAARERVTEYHLPRAIAAWESIVGWDAHGVESQQ